MNQNKLPVPASALRDLKATLRAEEFAAVKWASQHAGHLATPAKKALPLADFLRLSVLESVRAIVRREIALGHAIPPDIAHVLSDTVAGAKAWHDDQMRKTRGE